MVVYDIWVTWGILYVSELKKISVLLNGKLKKEIPLAGVCQTMQEPQEVPVTMMTSSQLIKDPLMDTELEKTDSVAQVYLTETLLSVSEFRF